MKEKLKIGSLIQHKHSLRIAKITDLYYPPDNPYVVSLTYKYVDTDKGRSMVDTDFDRFVEKWAVLDPKSKEIETIPA